MRGRSNCAANNPTIPSPNPIINTPNQNKIPEPETELAIQMPAIVTINGGMQPKRIARRFERSQISLINQVAQPSSLLVVVNASFGRNCSKFVDGKSTVQI